jgi:lysine 6-dehydrogenase
MKVVVPGATGKQGRGALWYLLRQKDVSEIIVGARGVEQVKALISELGDERLKPELIDLAEPESTSKLFRGAGVVINCAYEGYPTDDNYQNLEIPATRAALEAGVNYTNLGGIEPAPEQLGFHHGFKEKGLLAMPGMGELTGHLQIMAAYGIERLDKTDSVEIKYGERDLVPPDEHSRPISLSARPGGKGKTAMTSVGLGAMRFRYGSPSVCIEDGKRVYDPPRGRPEMFEFREPIGKVAIAQTPGAAVLSLSKSFPEIPKITFKAGGGEDFDRKINFLKDLGFVGSERIEVEGQKISPWSVLIALLARIPPEAKPPDVVSEAKVIVRGWKKGKEIEYAFSWTRIRGDSPRESVLPSSGLCAAVAGMMIARGKAKGTGVLMPEQAIPPEDYLAEFLKTGKGDIELTRREKM